MPLNTIALAKQYSGILDEVYKAASVTDDLTADPSMVRAGANAHEICYPQIDVGGLGDYDRNSGYTDAAVNVEWKSATFNYDRGAKISIDSQDDDETFGIAFGKGSSELIRTKVAPESDAFFFATLAGTEGISSVTGVTYEAAQAYLDALVDGMSKMDEDEVPADGRILYTTPTLYNSVMKLQTTVSREVLDRFAKVVVVPQSRFYTAIDLLDGKTAGEEAGHYKKASDAADINFMIVHKGAIMKWDKHVVSSIIAPENNPDSDAYIAKYRKYGIVAVYRNKAAGIYMSTK